MSIRDCLQNKDGGLSITPDETPKIITVDFDLQLAAGVTLSGVPTVTATPAGLTLSSHATSGGRYASVTIVSGQSDGSDYTLKFVQSNSNGEKVHAEALVPCRA